MKLFYKLNESKLITGIIAADVADATMREIQETNPQTYVIGKMVYDDKIGRPVKQIVTQMTHLEFIEKVGQQVFAAILIAKKTDIQVEMAYEAFMLASFINPKDPMVGQFLSLLVSKGLMTEAQKAAALA